MFGKIKNAVIVHLISIGLILGGWYLSIASVAVSASFRNNQTNLIDGWRLCGLAMIVAGAYLPKIAALFRKER